MSEIAREAHTLRSELEQAERERDLATAQLSMVGSEICSDPKMDPMDYRDPRWTPTLEEAAKLRAEAERLRDRLQTVVDEQVSPHETLPAEELITLLEHSLAEGRHERERLRGALERAERRLTELADVDTFDAEVPWPENEKPEERARAGAEDARAALAGEGEAKRCAWTYDETHCAWDSSCGEKWILEDGGPDENRIRFCHGCGKPVEVAPMDRDGLEMEVRDA